MLKNWPFLSETSAGHEKAIPSNRNRTSPKTKITVKLEKLQKLTHKNKVYADRIGGKFTITSYDGFNYILNMYSEELNITHSELLKNNTTE